MSNNINDYYTMEMMNDDVAMMQQAENSFTNNNPQVNGFNGRVFFLPNESAKPDNLYGGQQAPQELNDSLINNTLTSNPLSQAYFNVHNQNLIQIRIIEEIKKISNGEYIIGRQNDGELQIIMRSFYLQFGKNRDNDIASQVEELNKMVVDECVRIIVPNIQQYLGYRRDISNPIPVLPRSQNVSNKGRNTFSLLVV
jgi:hypothetical protein